MIDSVTDDLDAFKRRWEALSIDDKIDALYRAEANDVELPPMLIPIFEAMRDADNRIDDHRRSNGRGDQPDSVRPSMT